MSNIHMMLILFFNKTCLQEYLLTKFIKLNILIFSYLKKYYKLSLKTLSNNSFLIPSHMMLW